MKNIVRFLVLLLLPLQAMALVDLVIQNDDVPDPIPAGGEITYTISITNNAFVDTAHNVTSVHTFTPNSTFNGFNVVTPGVTCALSAPGEITCTYPDLLPSPGAGSAASVEILLGTSTAGTVTLGAVASTTDPETPTVPPAPNNNIADQSTQVLVGADVVMHKTPAAATVAAGTSFTWQLSVESLGPNAATELIVTDVVPAGFSVTSIPAGCTLSGGTITCLIAGPIAVGSTLVLGDVTGLITAASFSTVTNTAAVAVQAGAPNTVPRDPNTADNTAIASVTVDPGTDLEIDKASSAAGNPLVGDSFNFTLSPRFTGDSPTSITIVDNIPANYSIILPLATPQNGWACAVTGAPNVNEQVTCTKASGGPIDGLEDEPLGDIVIPVNVDTSSGGAAITNTATISTAGAPTESDLTNNTGSVSGIIADPTVELGIEKAGPNPALVVQGVEFDWDVTVNNNAGNIPFIGVALIQDIMPAGLTVNSINDGGGFWTCTVAGAPVVLPFVGDGVTSIDCRHTYTAGSPLPPGTDSTAVVFTTVAAATGFLTNSANVSGETCNLAGCGGQTTSYQIESNTNLSSADIGLEKTAIVPAAHPHPDIEAGHILTYILEIYNNDPAVTSLDVHLADTFDELINANIGPADGFISATIANDTVGGATCSTTPIGGGVGQDLACTFPGVAPCDSVANVGVALATCPTVTVQVRPGGDGGLRPNIASVISLGTSDPLHTNEVSSAAVNILARTDLTVTKTVQADPLPAGQDIVYTLTIANAGPSRANLVTLADVLPDDVMFISAVPSLGLCTPQAPLTIGGITAAGASTLDCAIGSINNGSQQTVIVTVRATTDANGTTLTNNATVAVGDPATPETNTANNGGTVDVTITQPSLAFIIGKSDSVDPLTAGTDTVYTISVTNSGPSTAEDVVIVDTLPLVAGLTFVSAVPSAGSCNPVVGGVLTCNLGTLLDDQLETVDVTMTGVGKGTFLNSVTVSSLETGLFPGDVLEQTTTEVTTVRTRVDMTVESKIATPLLVDIREDFIYTISIFNKNDHAPAVPGLDEAEGVTVSDSLPAGMELTGAPKVVASGAGAGGAAVGGTSCTGVAGGTSFNCGLGTMALGSRLDIIVPVQLVAVTQSVPSQVFTNTATVSVDPDKSFDINSPTAGTDNNSNSGPVTVASSTIAGTVYRDLDAGGTLSGGDTGIGGIVITLTGTTLVDGVAFTATATTAADGTYTLIGIPAGTYTITEGAIPAALNLVDGLESDGSIGGGDDTTVNDEISNIVMPDTATNATGYNFGELPKASIAGKVFADFDDTGIENGPDVGIGNVTVTLTGNDLYGRPVTIVIQTSIAAATLGEYIFDDLTPSDVNGYTITETHPSGFADGLDSIGGVIVPGSRLTDVLGPVILNAGDNLIDHDFAELGGSETVSGVVWVDNNNDGIRSAAETGRIGNTVITLTGIDENGDPISLTTTTAVDGSYSFFVRPSDATGYTITETHPTAWADGIDSAGSGGGTVGNDVLSNVVVNNGDALINYDFGEIGNSISGTVYVDQNSDGVNDPAEPGIPGVTMTLTGNDADGNPVNIVVVTGADGTYTFEGLPLPDGLGFTVTETQPGGIADGIDTVGSLGGSAAVNDVISGIVFPATGGHGIEYNFGEGNLALPGQISGSVWFDENHDRADNEGGSRAGWTVELIVSRADPLDNSAGNINVVATAITDVNGDYLFDNLSPGTYEIRFRHPEGGFIYGTPLSGGAAGDTTNGTIHNIVLGAGDNIIDQDLPIDPSGVVYDAITRAPVPGATVTFAGPPGFNPAVDLVGGVANLSQVTGATGLYQFLLFNTAPAGTYTLTVTSPAGYIPGVAASIPACTNTPTIGAAPPNPDPALVQNSAFAPVLGKPIHNPATCPATSAAFPAGDGSTQYFLSFDINPALPSTNVVNNHIPLDPILGGAIVVTKTTPKTNVVRGELVPYTITATNTLSSVLSNITLQDQIPPGFKYIAGSASVNGVSIEPNVAGRSLDWPNLTFAANEVKTFQMILIVGAGVSEGKYVNQAWALNSIANSRVSNVGTATVRVIPDPLFDCSDLIGKVFDDKNINGYQDEGEPGLAGVRVVTPRGLLITTDDYGRFHIACADVPNELSGSNFTMKLDTRTLPSGYRVTTENPRIVRLTRGKLVKLNFGAALHKVLRVDLDSSAFNVDGDQLTSTASTQLGELIEILKQQPSQVRLSYGLTADEDKADAKARMQVFTEQLESLWQECDCSNYALTVEQEVVMSSGDTAVWSTDGRVSR